MNYYSTGKFAKKAGVTERTLRYYDKIGLLKPMINKENGYRMYSDEDFIYLQKILVFKALNFSLDEIKMLIKDKSDILNSLDLQKQLISKRISYLKKIKDSIIYASDLLKKDEENIDWLISVINLLSQQEDLTEQYKNSNNLSVRIHLHNQFSTNPIKWFDWLWKNMDLSKFNTLLEIGAGNGQLWKNKKYLTRNREIFLTDISEGMLDDARHILGDDYSYFTVDCERIPFKKDFFDCIIANHVLFYLNDISNGLNEIRRVLKDNGVFYCTTYSQRHMRELTNLVKSFDESVYLANEPLYLKFGLENGKDILNKYFDNVSCKVYNDRLRVDKAKPIVDYILSCHGNQDKLMDKYEEFYSFVDNEIKNKGCILITKEACLFKCY